MELLGPSHPIHHHKWVSFIELLPVLTLVTFTVVGACVYLHASAANTPI